MAECGFCEREMTTAESCTKNAINAPAGTDPDRAPPAAAGTVWHAIPYGDEEIIEREQSRCPDCGVARGGFHHPGCDIEETPFRKELDTHHQLLSLIIRSPPRLAPRHVRIEADRNADVSMEDLRQARGERGV